MADTPHSTNAFLRNLSQKKYSWMQPSPGPSSTTTSEQSSPHVEAKRPAEDTPKSPQKKQRPAKRAPHEEEKKPAHVQRPPADTAATASPSPAPATDDDDDMDDKDNSDALADPLPAAPEKKSVRRVQQPRFKYTTFPVMGFSILPTRNITSTFDKSDVTFMPGHHAGEDAIAPEAEHEGRDTIIIHPGSRNLRIGRSSEAFPKTVPHVIARRMKGQRTDTTDTRIDTELDPDALREIKGELKWRMKAAKRRAVPNAEGQVIGFNNQAFQEIIPDHNDPYKVEWTEVNEGSPDFFVGGKALNLPMSQHPEYHLCYPWKYGSLNTQDYDSIQAVLGDLQTIWTETIRSELEIEDKTFEKYNAVLVVPDLFNKKYICELMTLLLRHMKFRGALVQPESTCATFGAGVSSACVVDIGAQKTSIACIEDGVCLADSRMSIAIGGDDITTTFSAFLLANQFPYADINLNRAYDWRLAEELKEKWCTMNESDISVQVYDFFVRVPQKPTKKYQCKVYDEVFLAPLCLVYPAILNASAKTEGAKTWVSKDVTDDIADESHASQGTGLVHWQPSFKNAPPSSDGEGTASRSNCYDVYPIDLAIAQSIQTASGASDERLKRFFTNIILVGGGGMVSNFNRVLEDRILSTSIAQAAKMERVEVLPAPRELDPRLLVWKGASVLSKLDTAKEMWIGDMEWDQVGARCLRDRALFV